MIMQELASIQKKLQTDCWEWYITFLSDDLLIFIIQSMFTKTFAIKRMKNFVLGRYYNQTRSYSDFCK